MQTEQHRKQTGEQEVPELYFTEFKRKASTKHLISSNLFDFINPLMQVECAMRERYSTTLSKD